MAFTELHSLGCTTHISKDNLKLFDLLFNYVNSVHTNIESEKISKKFFELGHAISVEHIEFESIMENKIDVITLVTDMKLKPKHR